MVCAYKNVLNDPKPEIVTEPVLETRKTPDFWSIVFAELRLTFSPAIFNIKTRL